MRRERVPRLGGLREVSRGTSLWTETPAVLGEGEVVKRSFLLIGVVLG